MFSKVFSGGILGIDGYLVHVEADVSDGLPGFAMVGYLSSEVKEAQDRVKTALRNSGFYLPAKKITVNLSPADIRKEGTAFDLPIAIAVLVSFGVVEPTELRSSLLVGELGLNGEVKPMKGAISIVAAARDCGLRRCFLPKSNMAEGSAIDGIDIIGIESVKELVQLLNHRDQIPESCYHREQVEEEDIRTYSLDYTDVNGMFLLRRATEIAISGKHNILYTGPAGTGKTMMAQRIPTIMPGLTPQEKLEISKIYSICGMLPSGSPLLSQRPFRNPHHTISPQALAGGGRIPKPGEISLASGGVLFLDEFPEFQKNTIEILRQPLEERRITISRIHGAYEFPADFLLVAAMNPCACGFYPDRNRCSCSEPQIRRYLGRISKPLLDRIDICAEAAPITYEELQGRGKNEDSKSIRTRVESVRRIQQQRFEGQKLHYNSEMGIHEINLFCKLEIKEEQFLEKVFSSMGFSARAYHKVLKVARTIADMDGSDQIQHHHLCEAVGYRSMENKFWNGGRSYGKELQ